VALAGWPSVSIQSTKVPVYIAAVYIAAVYIAVLVGTMGSMGTMEAEDGGRRGGGGLVGELV
jgi:hypothetical protein